MKHLTIRNVTPALAEALEKEKRARGTSLNRTVLEVLEQALGVNRRRSNGLAELAGGWTDDEQARFEEAIAVTEQVDEELWR